MTAQAAIQTNHLTKVFGDHRAVDGFTLSVAEGELFGLVGPDGAGKTTTLRMLCGVLDPTEGEVRVAGLDIRKETDAVQERIGYVSQRFGLYPDLTVLENILFYAELYGVARRRREAEVERLLAFSRLTGFKRRKAGALSGGMKQKLALACALVHTPRVLFLDEPTNGVDPVSRRDLWRLLYRLLQEKVTLFVSTAYLDEAERCGRVGLLHRGRLIACGTPAEVKKRMPGTLLEVRGGKSRRVAELLRGTVEGAVAVFGDRVHVVVADARKGKTVVEAALRTAGEEEMEILAVAPSLEDVFLTTVEGRDR